MSAPSAASAAESSRLNDELALASRGLWRWLASPWALLLVLSAAIALRLIGVQQWSLWQDEEMSIYFSQYQKHFFVRCFPPFFVLLGWLYELTGISTAAGRILAGFFGLLGIGLSYAFTRKYTSPQAGLFAALLLTIALGHLFWSQSIRYYTMLAVVQFAATWLFFDGIEENRLWKLFAAGTLVSFGLFVHFTAILLLPAWVGYVILVFLTRQHTPNFGWRQLVAVLVPLGLGLMIFFPQFLVFRVSGAAGPPPTVQPPLPLVMRLVAYYGLPMFGLALISPLFWRTVPPRFYLLMFCVALVPNLETIVLGMFSLANITWYHAFIAMHGAAALAAISLAGLYRWGYTKMMWGALAASLVYYGVFLSLYYTTMHGDRERWQDGAAYLQQAASIDSARQDNPLIHATVPEVVAYYLGVSPDRARPQGPLVLPIDDAPPTTLGTEPLWYLVKQTHVTPQYQAWFDKHFEHKAEFPAHTLFIDRTVHVYYWPGKPAAGSLN